MGLDISAYSRLELIEVIDEAEGWENKYWAQDPDSTCHAHPLVISMTELYWPGRSEGIISGGVYRINGDTHKFRAGSYGGYNEWREWLTLTMLSTAPREIWDHPELYQGDPFYELINFSDCEGIIGPAISSKLARDFVDHAHMTARADAWQRDRYNDWAKAFQLAADFGMVEFH